MSSSVAVAVAITLVLSGCSEPHVAEPHVAEPQVNVDTTSDGCSAAVTFTTGLDELTAPEMVVLADGRVVVGSPNGPLWLWDLQHSKRIETIENGGETTALAALTDGRFASGDSRGIVRIWDTNPLRLIVSFDHHQLPVDALASLPDGRIISADFSGLWVWSPEEPEQAKHHATEWRGRIAVLTDGRIVSSSNQIYDLDGGQLDARTLWAAFGDYGGWDVAVLPDDRIITSGVWGNNAIVDPNRPDETVTFDVPGGELTTKHSAEHAGALGVLADGRFVTSGMLYKVLLWDDETTTPTVLGHHGELVTDLQGLPDGRVISASSDGTVKVWDPNATPHDQAACS